MEIWQQQERGISRCDYVSAFGSTAKQTLAAVPVGREILFIRGAFVCTVILGDAALFLRSHWRTVARLIVPGRECPRIIENYRLNRLLCAHSRLAQPKQITNARI